MSTDAGGAAFPPLPIRPARRATIIVTKDTKAMKRMILLAAVILAGPAGASTYRLANLEVAQPWSRPAVAGTNGIGYMILSNQGRSAAALVSVDSPLATKVEIHKSSMAGGVMSMRLQHSVEIPAGRKATFGPGGYHLMLIGLTKSLKAGDEIPATLNFAGGRHLKVAFTVGTGPAAATLPDMGPMDHMAGMKH